MRNLLDNALNRGNKREIVNWAIPDYSAVISITGTATNYSYTAPSDGMYCCAIQVKTNNTISINGNAITNAIDYPENSRADYTPFQITVKSGDVINVSGYQTAGYFVPLSYETADAPTPPVPLGNYTVVGSPTISNNEVTNSDNDNYIMSDVTMECPSENWNLYAKITTGADVTTEQTFVVSTHNEWATILGIKNGAWWFKNAVGNQTGGTVSANTTYWIDVEFYGSGYLMKVSNDGINYDTVAAIISYGVTMNGQNVMSGDFGGTLYLENLKFYVSGSLFWEAIDSE